MTDILGVVYDFIKAYAWREDDAPQYADSEIIRGWQNTGTLPQGTTQFCVITLLRSERHGAPVNFPDLSADHFGATVAALVEHAVQVDFCSAEPFVLPQATKTRADIIQMLAFNYFGVDFFQQADDRLRLMYADNVNDLSFLDPDKLYTARYQTVLHISEQQYTNFLNVDYFTSVNLHTENVDAHHKN